MIFKKGLVSVCIPTYNGEAYIQETLNSVLNQSYQNIEVIINDDCSYDSTMKIISLISDDRVKCYSNREKKGLAGNWNEAVRHASGEYIKLLCQDDILFPDALLNQVRAINSDEIACVIGNTDVIDSSGQVIIKRNRFKNDRMISGYKFAKRSLRGRNIYCEPGNLLYRTELFYKYGPYDKELKYTPDWDFAIRISCESKIYCLKDYIMSFRVSDNSETSRLYREKMKKLIKDTERLMEKQKVSKKIKINFFDVLFFKIVIRLFSVIRLMVLQINNKM